MMIPLFCLSSLLSGSEESPGQSIRCSPAARERRISELAETLRPKLIEMRRDFHMNPELSNREERTSRIVAERLRALGLEDIKTGVGKHGVIALLKGGRAGPVVAMRADMDALPISETIEVSYKSKNPGVKHACGHDAHTAIGLGVAELLMSLRDQIPGTVKFVFQPAEERAPAGEEGGASLMIKEGALESPRPQAIFGLHVMPMYEVGQVAVLSGAAMASSDRFVITLRGRKVHAAYPHLGVDTVVVAAHAIVALQTIRGRRTDTQEPVVLSIGSIRGGNRYNILADEVVLEGTLRTLNEKVRSQIHQMIRETLDGVTTAFGATFDLMIEEVTAVTMNDPVLAEGAVTVLKRVLGDTNVRTGTPQMGAEDFSYYQRVVPGLFYFLGAGNKAKNITAMIHTPEFDLDEESLVVGVKAMASVLLDFLEENAVPGQ